MSKLIILRGNSGSGKSAAALEIANTASAKTAIIEGDYYRRYMLFPIGECGEDVEKLMTANVDYLLNAGYIVLWVSIFYAHDRNRKYLEAFLKKHPKDNFIFDFDVSFEETTRRHQTRELRHKFSVEQMREWYHPVESLDYDFEYTIPESSSLQQTVDFIRKTAQI